MIAAASVVGIVIGVIAIVAVLAVITVIFITSQASPSKPTTPPPSPAVAFVRQFLAGPAERTAHNLDVAATRRRLRDISKGDRPHE